MTDRTQQAGAIAVRLGPEPRFLLVTSRRAPKVWIFPKGHIEHGESVTAAAQRELFEEAGVTGIPLEVLGSLRFRSGNEDVEVHYVLLEASNEGESREGRAIQWLTLEEALKELSFADTRALLQEAARYTR